MKYLIDTNIWIDALGGVKDALDVLNSYEDIALSAISYAEVASGCSPDEQLMFDGLLNIDPSIQVIHTDELIIKLAASFNRNRETGKGYGSRRLPDAIIGATAAITGRTILTRNAADFVGFNRVTVEVPYQGQWVKISNPGGGENVVWLSTPPAA